MFMGRVRTSSIGLKIAFAAPRTTATVTAVVKLSTLIPGSIRAVTNTARLLNRMCGKWTGYAWWVDSPSLGFLRSSPALWSKTRFTKGLDFSREFSC